MWGGDIRCDFCNRWIIGELSFLDDETLCHACYKALALPHTNTSDDTATSVLVDE